MEREGLYERSLNHIGKAYILIFLNSQGKGADIAKEEAAAWAGQMEFINSNASEEQVFRFWLSGKTDIMPETMPANKYIMGYPHRKNVELCYLSKVCTFTERLIVYGIKKGYVEKDICCVKKRKSVYSITLNRHTDFASLSRPKANNWILRFREIAETAFQNSDTRSRILGNLLVIERYVHTLQQGLLVKGKSLTPVLLNALAYNSDEKLTDSQADFYKSSFENEKPTTIEWQITTPIRYR